MDANLPSERTRWGVERPFVLVAEPDEAMRKLFMLALHHEAVFTPVAAETHRMARQVARSVRLAAIVMDASRSPDDVRYRLKDLQAQPGAHDAACVLLGGLSSAGQLLDVRASFVVQQPIEPISFARCVEAIVRAGEAYPGFEPHAEPRWLS